MPKIMLGGAPQIFFSTSENRKSPYLTFEISVELKTQQNKTILVANQENACMAHMANTR